MGFLIVLLNVAFFLFLHVILLQFLFRWLAKFTPTFGRSALATVAASTTMTTMVGLNLTMAALLGEQPSPLSTFACFVAGLCLVAAILRNLIKNPEGGLISWGKAIGITLLSAVLPLMVRSVLSIFAIRTLGTPS